MYPHICLNTPPGLTTYIHSANGSESVLDLCFSSASIASGINAKQGPCLGSDHYPICVSILLQQMLQSLKKRKRYKLNEVKWDKWTAGLPDLEWNENLSISEASNSLIHALKNSTYKIDQTSDIYQPKYNKPWWDTECSKLVAFRRKAKKEFCKNQTAVNLKKLSDAENRAKHYINELKKKTWQAHATTLNTSTPLTTIWRQIHIMRNKSSPTSSVIEHQNNSLTSASEISEFFSSHYERN